MPYHEAVQAALEYAGHRNHCNEGGRHAMLADLVYHDRELRRAIDEAFAAAAERKRQREAADG